VPSKIVVKRKEGPVSKSDVEATRRLLIDAVPSSSSGSRDGAPRPRIREVTLESEAVVVKVWDSVSRAFVVEALRLSPYRVEVQEGHVRMAMTVSSTWGSYTSGRFMEVLWDQNPGLPSGAITYVSRSRGNGGGWTVFVDVSRQGMIFLGRSGFILQALLETVRLRPAEN
jgi:hypothetical protein